MFKFIIKIICKYKGCGTFNIAEEVALRKCKYCKSPLPLPDILFDDLSW